MSYTIQTECTAPCYASEADKERGKEVFEARIRENYPALLAAADWARTNGYEHLVSKGVMTDLETAERDAEYAITEGWADQTADSGVIYSICLDDVPANLAQSMDDDLREELHNLLGQIEVGQWIVSYAEKHLEKFGEEWAPISGGAW